MFNLIFKWMYCRANAKSYSVCIQHMVVQKQHPKRNSKQHFKKYDNQIENRVISNIIQLLLYLRQVVPQAIGEHNL